jgi:hypothetical protein
MPFRRKQAFIKKNFKKKSEAESVHPDKKNPPPFFNGEGHHQNTLHLSLSPNFAWKLRFFLLQNNTTNIRSLALYLQNLKQKKLQLFCCK